MRYSKKGWEKRKKDREGYPDFYKKHIKYIKDNNVCCEECGVKLKGSVGEVAHILNKSYFKSIALEDLNILYLCDHNSLNQCHNKLDNLSNNKVKKMFVFSKIMSIFDLLEEKIKEDIPYKTYDRYSWET